jgi:WD40 repeat protein
MRRDALVVGINIYTKLKDLTTPAEDAEAVARLLTDYGEFTVKRLPTIENKEEDQGTYRHRVGRKTKVNFQDLQDALIQLFTPAGNPPDTALFYFAGHGLQQALGFMREGYLATSDIDLKHNWGFPLNWLRKLVETSQVKQKIIWLDCCHSGELVNFYQPSKDTKPDNHNNYDLCFITACREFEQAYEDVKFQHGLLTSAILKGLDPTQKQDGIVTSHTLSKFTEQQLLGGPQVPNFYNTEKSIIFTKDKLRKSNNINIINNCPYKGLHYFEEQDADIFYGRTKLIDELIDQIERGNFQAILGASGSGKSSVIRAGLLHQLKSGHRLSGSKDWDYYGPFTPAKHPLQQLLQAIGNECSDLVQFIQQAKAERVVLVIDQFEECFTLCQDEAERQQFFDCLLKALNTTNSKLRFVIGMRADFLGRCSEYPGLADRITEHLVTVKPMNEEELRDTIIEPAKQAGLELDGQLVNQMVKDVLTSPGSLPLLQYTLTELWQEYKKYLRPFTLENYNNLGGVNGTLSKVADQVYNDLEPEEQRVAQRIFLELTHLGDGAEDTRRRILLRNLPNRQQPQKLIEQVIKKLADARLITITDLKYESKIQENSKTLLFSIGRSDHEVVIDIIHEALIRHWKKLRQWIKERRDAMRIERKLEERAKDWLNHRKSEDLALRGAELDAANEYFEKYLDWGQLDDDAQEFIQFSQNVKARQDREQEEQLRREQERSAALEKALTQSNLREQAVKAQSLLPSRPVESLLEAMKATSLSAEKLHGEVLSLVFDSLLWALSFVRERNRLHGHQFEVSAIAVNSQVQRIVSSSLDGTLRLWDLQGNLIGQPFQELKAPIRSVAFNSNGKVIVSGDDDGRLGLWDLEGRLITSFEGHKDWVTALAFSPDGKLIVSGSFDKTLRLWDLQGNPIGEPFRGHEAPVTSVTFSRNGKLIISGSRDTTVRLWNSGGKSIKLSSNEHDYVTAVAFSPKQPLIAWGSGGGIISLWDLQERRIKISFPAHDKSISSIAFSPDGQWIITGSDDSTIGLWDLQGNRVGRPLMGHEQAVTTVAFGSDRNLIVSASADKTIRLWSLQEHLQRKLFQTKRNPHNRVNSVAFSPDSKRIISANKDCTLKLWDLQGKLIESLSGGHEAEIISVAFSPDSQWMITGSADRTLRLWTSQGKLMGQPFRGHKHEVMSVAFSPDSKLIVSGGADQTLRLWDLQGNLIGQPFRGHEDMITSVAFSPNGTQIISAGYDGALYLWDVNSNQTTQPLQQEGGSGILSVTFSADGQWIVSASMDQTLQLWSYEGKAMSQLQGHKGQVTAVAFSPDSRWIISGSADHTLRLWDVKGNSIGPPLEGHNEKISSVAFSPDGQWIISGSYDGTLRLWRGNPKTYLHLAYEQLRYHSLLKDGTSELNR